MTTGGLALLVVAMATRCVGVKNRSCESETPTACYVYKRAYVLGPRHCKEPTDQVMSHVLCWLSLVQGTARNSPTTDLRSGVSPATYVNIPPRCASTLN